MQNATGPTATAERTSRPPASHPGDFVTRTLLGLAFWVMLVTIPLLLLGAAIMRENLGKSPSLDALAVHNAKMFLMLWIGLGCAAGCAVVGFMRGVLHRLDRIREAIEDETASLNEPGG